MTAFTSLQKCGTFMDGTLNICLLKPYDVVTRPEELQNTTMYALGMLPLQGLSCTRMCRVDHCICYVMQ